MASIMGAVTSDPMHENMFLIKLFNATPVDDFLGMNSVNIVVAMLNMSIDPTPKKKLAAIWETKLASHPPSKTKC